MTFFEYKPFLRQCNPFLELNINHLCTVSFDYHNTNTFPVNILALGLKDDGNRDSYYENKAENQRLPILADHVYFLPCDLEIRFEITQGVTLIAMHFSLTFFSGVDIFSGSKRCEMRHDPEMVARFQALWAEKDELKAMCGLKAEVMRLCASCWPADQGRLTPAIRKYEPLFRHVREQGDAALTVGALAAMANQRRDVFSRNFSRDVGKSPKAFLQNELLKKITTRLLAPQASVKQTAAELKFCSEFYMSHFFKKHTGLSPSEYQDKFCR